MLLDRGGAGGARAPPEFGVSEKRTDRQIHNLLQRVPLDLKIYLRLCTVIPTITGWPRREGGITFLL